MNSNQPKLCGRVAHATRQKAFKRILALRRAEGPGADGLHPFYCGRCLAWHVGRPKSFYDLKRSRGQTMLYQRPGGDA